MKTEPAEAYEHLRSWWFEELEDDYCTTDSANEAIKIAFQEGQSSTKIKQLEWKKNGGEYWEAITPIGAYSITLDFGVYVAFYDMDNDVDGEWRSLAKAKAAAQADFEKRINECLE